MLTKEKWGSKQETYPELKWLKCAQIFNGPEFRSLFL